MKYLILIAVLAFCGCSGEPTDDNEVYGPIPPEPTGDNRVHGQIHLNDRPLAGAEVSYSYSWASGAGTHKETTTDTNGQFTFSSLPDLPGNLRWMYSMVTVQVLRMRDPTVTTNLFSGMSIFSDELSSTRSLDPTVTTNLIWEISANSTITGTVAYPQPPTMPRPASLTFERIHNDITDAGPACIDFLTAREPPDFSFRTTTALDPDGTFVCTNLPAGNYAIFGPPTNIIGRWISPPLFPTIIVSLSNNATRTMNIAPTKQ